MAILEIKAFEDIKMSDEQIRSIHARLTLRELKNFRYENERGQIKKLKKKDIFERLNEDLAKEEMLPDVFKFVILVSIVASANPTV